MVQRYGEEVAGGAELACRQFAVRMAARGHDVHVATTCARNYTDWANAFPAGDSEVEGVTLHRLPVVSQRDNELFNALNPRLLAGYKPVPLHLQRSWMRAQGPYTPALAQWLAGEAGRFDVVSFFTYLYWTTWAGLPVAARRTATVLHPCAHDEPPLYLPIFDPLVRVPDGLAMFTEEEAALIRDRFHLDRPEAVTGIGIDVTAVGDAAAFRATAGGALGDRPYLLYVGRVDPHKGSTELFDFFVTYKARNPGPLALVVVGDPVLPLDAHPDVVPVGFVAEEAKTGAMAGALALVQPSYFESFSLVLCEAWVQGRPALVQGRCAVLDGQVRRSGGGLPYTGFAEFEAAVDRLWGDPGLREAMGQAGRRYVEANYHWDAVLDRYERLLEAVA
ncbi:MAG: hypothetical protein QOG64_1988 [Acidimicrobiaceae bacterium]|nr:hypothetical protein [Acidimicrobiaceae bacterium]